MLSAVMCLALCGFLYVDDAGDFSFIIISDVHVPTYMYTIGQALDEETLMQMHNQKRLKQFVEETLAMESKPDFVINNGDTGDAGWVTL